MKWQFRNDMPIYTQIVEQIKVAISMRIIFLVNSYCYWRKRS